MGDGRGDSYSHSASEMEAYLQSVPVEYLAVETEAIQSEARTLLRTVLQSAPERYVEFGPVGLDRKGAGELVLYRNGAAQRKSGVGEVNLGRGKGNRILRLHLDGGKNP